MAWRGLSDVGMVCCGGMMLLGGCWHGMLWLAAVGMARRLLAWRGVGLVARQLLAWHVVACHLLAWLVGITWLVLSYI